MAKQDNTPDLLPWERQPDESAKNYEAFKIYYEMGVDRSLRKVAEKLEKSETLMGRWSGQFDWVKRADAWDKEQERLARIENQKEIAKMRKRHAQLARKVLEKVDEALDELQSEDVGAANIGRLIDVASKLERISLGDVGEVVEERQGEAAASPVTFYIPSNGRDQDEEEDI